jgi:hypothetical protein
MGQTRLPVIDPVLIDAVAIADQEAWPRRDQGPQGLCGAVGSNARVSDLVGGHAPEPLHGILAVPRRVVTVAHWGLGGQRGNGLIVGRDGVRDAPDDCLHRPQADREVEDGGTAILDETPRGALDAGEGSAPGTQARAIAGLLVAWHLRFALSSASWALPLLEEEMVDSELDGRHLNDLMGVVGRQCDQVALATGTGTGRDEMDCSRAQ